MLSIEIFATCIIIEITVINPTVETYMYSYFPSDSGYLQYIGASGGMGPVLEFDDHGYHKTYSVEPAGHGWIEFEYSTIR